MSFFSKAGDVFLRQRANSAQNLDTLQRLNLHGINQGQQMHLAHVANGLGLDPQAFLQPYGVPAPNVNIQQAPQPPQQQSSFWPIIAGTLLGATGLGAVGGGLYALKNTPIAPTSTQPAQKFKVDIGFDENKGFQFGQPEPVK